MSTYTVVVYQEFPVGYSIEFKEFNTLEEANACIEENSTEYPDLHAQLIDESQAYLINVLMGQVFEKLQDFEYSE